MFGARVSECANILRFKAYIFKVCFIALERLQRNSCDCGEAVRISEIYLSFTSAGSDEEASANANLQIDHDL